MFSTKNIPEAVINTAKLNITGNVIPASWYQHIKKPKTGNAYHLAINILSEVIYWYRPTEIKDNSGKTKGYKKKFKEDMLQKSYKELAERFGETKKPVKQAVQFLRENGYLETEFRSVNTGKMILSNVLFLAPVPEKIQSITEEITTKSTAPTKKSIPSIPYGTQGIDHVGQTYTKITNTKNSKYTPQYEELTPQKNELTAFQEIELQTSTENLEIQSINDNYLLEETCIKSLQENDLEDTIAAMQENLNKHGVMNNVLYGQKQTIFKKPNPEIFTGESTKKYKKTVWFKIPDMIENEFLDPENINFLNRPDEEIIILLPQFLEDDEKRENLEVDIETFFRFARENKASEALIKKLININQILDKFDLKQYLKAYDIALARGKSNKLSYLRKVLEKAFMPLIYENYKNQNISKAG